MSDRSNADRPKDCENCRKFLTYECPVVDIGLDAFDKRIVRKVNKRIDKCDALHCKRWKRRFKNEKNND